MNTEIVTGSTVTKTMWLTLLLGELQELIWDARWLMLAIVLCIAADFRYGWGECNKRYVIAKAEGNKTLTDKYRWRGSRAWRRTVNKFFDYLMWVVVGLVVGKALLSELGIDYIYGGIAMTGVAVCCEAASFFGHFFYLHGVEVKQRTVMGFFKALAVAIAKRKSPDIGDALGEAFEKTDENECKTNIK